MCVSLENDGLRCRALVSLACPQKVSHSGNVVTDSSWPTSMRLALGSKRSPSSKPNEGNATDRVLPWLP